MIDVDYAHCFYETDKKGKVQNQSNVGFKN